MSAINNMFKKVKDRSNRNSVHLTDFSLNLNKTNEYKDRDTNSLSADSEINTRQNDMYSDLGSLSEQNTYETKDNFQNTYNHNNSNNKNISPKQNTFVCETCNESSSNSQFIILNCNHIFHINCLAKIQLKNAINCQVIDNDTFFNKVKCSTCQDHLESSEIMMIHNKFYKGTSVFINDHNKSIDKLEKQINSLKEEMKVCMEYKQKLEFEQQKSKQILTLLNTLPL